MKTRPLTFLLLLCCSVLLSAQSLEATRFEERSLALGAGCTNLKDTYLSPLSYSGSHATLMSEYFSQAKAPNGRWFVQSLFTLHGDYATLASGNGLTVGGMADYSYTYYYKVPLQEPSLRCYVGPQGQLRIGGLYNLRNSNNPAQLKLGINLAASAIVQYGFFLWSTPMNVRLQTDLPLLGTAFGPDYEQSYYEIFYLGQSEGCIHLTSLHNNLSLRANLSYDIELSSCTLRLTLANDLYQWSLGSQHYQMFTHTLMVGCVKNLYRVTRDEEARQHIPY